MKYNSSIFGTVGEKYINGRQYVKERYYKHL
nr:MAG TPA: hypothetical protein [Microviridae sp.]